MALNENRIVHIHEHTTQNIKLTIEDKYNTDKLCGYIEEHKRMMIKAESYTCKSMETRGAQGPVRMPCTQAGKQLQGARLHHQQVIWHRAHGKHQAGEVRGQRL
ncbi:MAG: hypothetical protein ACKPKO_61930, partial [Candidatus Fonsibacter sp.]